MTTGTIFWAGQPVPFRVGETVASALMRAGIAAFGTAPTGQARAVFCGIGLCQGCLIRAEGRITEACLLPARDGLRLSPEIGGDDA
ncbi:2Fe-2S iron-sulfur cluster-binding protein [Phaeovulum sp. NW3]|uniref:2Fe-2S iron-sulfur cluster-binding protein n=1 Tax=Phaeovulum sp. NW3 TaxID=2934933 RepID=UPI00202083DE|nr:2Fe-2S iron-sulfur cluster-binding protein [Phaeovulum sp. NW3]MCL7463528.1 (2Fe-2S)-binding protein [Phaeovulum sp. NW3]